MDYRLPNILLVNRLKYNGYNNILKNMIYYHPDPRHVSLSFIF